METKPNMALLSNKSWLLQCITAVLILLVCIVAATNNKDGTKDEGGFLLQHRYLKGAILEDDAMFTDLFPLQPTDYIGFVAAVAGLMLAAGGGIGGGGILVPIYILLFEFPVKRTCCDHLQFLLLQVSQFLILHCSIFPQTPFLWLRSRF